MKNEMHAGDILSIKLDDGTMMFATISGFVDRFQHFDLHRLKSSKVSSPEAINYDVREKALVALKKYGDQVNWSVETLTDLYEALGLLDEASLDDLIDLQGCNSSHK